VSVDPFPSWWIWFGPAGIVFVILLSVVVRRVRGKPIFPRTPAGALFVERMASGLWAGHCLIVAVTHDVIFVTPFFPFNLMFLPEIYRLELSIPIETVRSVEESGRPVFNILVIYGEAEKKLRLRLRNPAAFIETINRIRT
jgi:hypothetical protein